MNILESFKVAIASILSNKMRSFLTMLGIIIGISSVITIVSIGKGGQSAITGEFNKIGVNVLEATIDTSAQINQNDYFTMNDVKNIKSRIPEVLNAAPIFQKGGVTVKVGNETKRAVVIGTNNDYNSILSVNMLYGRFISEKDVLSGRNVVIIDDISSKSLFGYVDSTGKTIKIGERSMMVSATIVGVYKSQGGAFASSFGDRMPVILYTPITFAEKMFQDDFKINQIEILVDNAKSFESASNSINRILSSAHHNKDKYKVDNLMKQLDEVNRILNIFTMIIGAIAGISLVVGGIGVMNIMLVSVTERTREIGIRKAIGATRRDILVQFLIESVIISLIGGAIGMALGILFATIIGSFLGIAPGISFLTVLIAFLFSSAVGIFFGIYPANKASKLDPIEALRYE